MIAWMLWAALVTVLLAAAAAAVDRCLRLVGVQARWAWVAAGVGALALMVWSWLGPAPTPAPPGSAEGLAAVAAALARDVSLAMPAGPDLAERAAPWIAAAWATTSALLLFTLVTGLWRLARRARRWPSAVVSSGRVLVSDSFGPAVVGILDPRIVVPSWALGLGADRLRMACLHEDEHRRTGDGLLLLWSALLTAVFPWNPGAWWIHRRLRVAVEIDCDRRVLRGGADPVTYGSLLLELSMRAQDPPSMVAAFARPRPTLERRMMMIVSERAKVGPGLYGRLVAGVAVAAALVVAACETPEPTGVEGEVVAEPAAGVLVKQRDAELRARQMADHEAEMAYGPRQEAYADSDAPAGTFRLREGSAADFTDGLVERANRQSAGVVRFGPDATEGPGPLIYIDGVRADEAALANLSPEGIDRIEVIKGAAAAALYGDEAAGGVIQIFLK